jgi:hypothetical protein
VDEYFDLTSSQKDWLKTEFEKDFAKIKSQQLPKAANDLDRLSKMITTKKIFSEKEVEVELELFFNYFSEVIKTFSQNAISFAGFLSAKQVDTFQKKFRENLSDFRISNTQQKAQERILTSFGNWFGNLEPSQTTRINNFINENPFPVDSIISNRLRIADEFKEAFPIDSSRNSFVEKLFTDYKSMLDSNYTELRKNRNKNFTKLLTSILNSMTDTQRNSLALKLNDWSIQLLQIK